MGQIDLLSFAGVAGLTLLLVQLIKFVLPKDEKWPVITGIVLAVIISVLYGVLNGKVAAPDQMLALAVQGLFAAASATGVYEWQGKLPNSLLKERTPGAPPA